MFRYFIEVAYKGAAYSGFQIQQNANSIQAEVQKALTVFYRKRLALPTELQGDGQSIFSLTGSSRTDAGVNAWQNYFHFDLFQTLPGDLAGAVYHLNAILPGDIIIRRIIPVDTAAHCRFDALSREYHYFVYQQKNPFLADRAYYYPFSLQPDLLRQAAAVLMEYEDFTSFSKRNSQVFTHICHLTQSEWQQEGDCLVYKVTGDRFLRGMVRGLTGTMLQVGRKKITLEQFRHIIEAKNAAGADFAVPGHGLFLAKVLFPAQIVTG